MNTPSNDIVMVPVPTAALPQVTEVLNRYYQAQAAGTLDQELVTVAGNGEWSEAEIAELYAMFRNEAGRAVLRLVAQAGGEPVTYGAMAEVAGLNFNELRAHLAWFARYSKKIKGSNIWPITVAEDSNKPKGERYEYRMPERIAEWWLACEDDPSPGTCPGRFRCEEAVDP
jgi:hypothetical protein